MRADVQRVQRVLFQYLSARIFRSHGRERRKNSAGLKRERRNRHDDAPGRVGREWKNQNASGRDLERLDRRYRSGIL